MLSKNDLIDLLKISVIVDNVDESTSMSTCQNWDSLGHLAIMANLSKITSGQSDKIRELAMVESYSQLVTLLENNGLM